MILMRAALNRVLLSGTPALIAGDWNCDPTLLPTWPHLQQLGYVEAFSGVQAKLDVMLPATCKGATRFDTALVPPILMQALCSAHVWVEEHLFDAHSPLTLDFSLPTQLPCYHRWRLPKTWNDFQFAPKVMGAWYERHCETLKQALQGITSQDGVESSFLLWAKTVEDSVDAAVRQQVVHSAAASPPGLPKSHRGRCRPLQRIQRPVPQLPRPGRHGDFMVDVETTSLRVKWRLRQCRRVRTLLGGVRKMATMASPPDSLVQQLLNEWLAISRAKGYGSSFAQWVLSWDFVQFWPVDFPSEPWLHDLLQLLQYDCQALAAHVASQRSNYRKASIQADIEVGFSRQGFQALKPKPRPPFTAMSSQVTQ